MQRQTKEIRLTTVKADRDMERQDLLAIEEPLEIRLEYGPEKDRKMQNVAVTMRTPGNDAELATGFLFTEGILKKAGDVAAAATYFIACAENKENVILVSLIQGIVPDLVNSERNFYTTSSCGVCGKSSIQAIRTVSAYNGQDYDMVVDSELLYRLPEMLRQHQSVFDDTGGLHASALFGMSGELLLVREDVGRHNALDKLIGAALMQGSLPLNDHILLLSGRASFELVQKAAMAGMVMIASVGAPSSLAVELAGEFGITLVGFLKDQRYNIYTSKHRIALKNHEDTYQGQ